jgi:YkoP domain
MLHTIINRFDAFQRRRQKVFEFTDDPDCLLRLQISQSKYQIHLPDCEMSPGDQYLDLHLWNEHVPPIPPEGPNLAWASRTRRMFVASLSQVAELISKDPQYEEIKMVRGITVLLTLSDENIGKSMVERLGFTLMPYHQTLGRFGEFWENFYTYVLMWAFNPNSLRNRHLISSRRTEFWMCIDDFLQRYLK